jgi:hypothetical protein
MGVLLIAVGIAALVPTVIALFQTTPIAVHVPLTLWLASLSHSIALVLCRGEQRHRRTNREPLTGGAEMSYSATSSFPVDVLSSSDRTASESERRKGWRRAQIE